MSPPLAGEGLRQRGGALRSKPRSMDAAISGGLHGRNCRRGCCCCPVPRLDSPSCASDTTTRSPSCSARRPRFPPRAPSSRPTLTGMAVRLIRRAAPRREAPGGVAAADLRRAVAAAGRRVGGHPAAARPRDGAAPPAFPHCPASASKRIAGKGTRSTLCASVDDDMGVGGHAGQQRLAGIVDRHHHIIGHDALHGDRGLTDLADRAAEFLVGESLHGEIGASAGRP